MNPATATTVELVHDSIAIAGSPRLGPSNGGAASLPHFQVAPTYAPTQYPGHAGGGVYDATVTGGQVSLDAVIMLRLLLTSKAAGVCIGVKGATMDTLRRQTGARAGVSRLVEGVNDRVMSITGSIGQASLAIAIVAQTLADHPITASTTSSEQQHAPTPAPPSSADGSGAASAATPTEAATPTVATTSLRLLIPSLVMGTLIGRGGSAIKLLQDMYRVRVVTAKMPLPMSTERLLEISGEPRAIGAATSDLARVLAADWTRILEKTTLYDPRVRTAPRIWHDTSLEHSASLVPSSMHDEPPVSFGTAAAAASPSLPTSREGPLPVFQRSGGSGPVSGHLYPRSPVPYGSELPQSPTSPTSHPMQQQQQQQQKQHQLQQELMYATAYAPRGSPSAAGSSPHRLPTPAVSPQMTQLGSGTGGMVAHGAQPVALISQSVLIPDSLIGSLIGRGGQRLAEIRTLSGARIVIERAPNTIGERSFTVMGSRDQVELALHIVYEQLAERGRLAALGHAAATAQQPPASGNNSSNHQKGAAERHGAPIPTTAEEAAPEVTSQASSREE
ncbi:hypothetical protein BC828DRAFT_407065 [Blastocladiella britannica]|nr:hypothetical protein BC828DRAFT_407065 [Blastocladiella britannica]